MTAFGLMRPRERDSALLTGLVAGFAGNASGRFLRIGATLEFLDWAFAEGPGPTEISKRAMERAIRFYREYLLQMAERAFHDAQRRADEVLALEIARKIKQNRMTGYFTSTEVRPKWKVPGQHSARDFDAALQFLVDARWIEPAPKRAGATHGSMKKQFLINRRVHQT